MLLHTETEVYFGLNEVGREIWESLYPACGDLTEVCEVLGRKHPDVAPAELARDIAELIRALESAGLVVAND